MIKKRNIYKKACFPAMKSSGEYFIRYGLPVFISLCFIAACDKIDFFSKPYVATVNGSRIYLEDYQRQLDKKMSMMTEDFINQPDYMKRFEDEVLDGIITESIMDLRAKELNISVSDKELDDKIEEIKKDYGEDFTSLFAQGNIKYEDWKESFRKEMLIQKLVGIDVNSKIKISDNEAEDYFDEHRDIYKSDARVRVAQIVVHDLEKAREALKRLAAGEDFAAVAAGLSIGPEAKRGGDLGFITRWIMPEPLDKTIFSMSVNKTSPIVKSSYGFHIFKILENQPASTKSFAEAKEDVMADLRLQKEEEAFAVWLTELKKKAKVTKEENIKTKKITNK